MWILRNPTTLKPNTSPSELTNWKEFPVRSCCFLASRWFRLPLWRPSRVCQFQKFNYALFLWKMALFPVLVSVLPMKRNTLGRPNSVSIDLSN